MAPDLIAVVVSTLLLVPLVYWAPADPLRVLLGILVVLFFPGYVLLAAMYPRAGSLGGVERIALSIGISLAVVPIIGIVINFSPFSISLASYLTSLTAWTVAWAGAALLKRHRVPEPERLAIPPVGVWVRGLRERRRMELLPNAVLVLVLLGAVGVTTWRVLTPPLGEGFTEFYVLGAEGSLQDYPTRLRVSGVQPYNLGVVNRERRTETYRITAYLGETPVGEAGPLTLRDRESWSGQVEVTPATQGEGQRLEFRLMRGGAEEAYRTLHLFVDVR